WQAPLSRDRPPGLGRLEVGELPLKLGDPGLGGPAGLALGLERPTAARSERLVAGVVAGGVRCRSIPTAALGVLVGHDRSSFVVVPAGTGHRLGRTPIATRR